MSFKGRVAIITGGANGIGFATAEALAQGGCRVVLVDIDDKRLIPAIDALSKYSVDTLKFSCDVSNKSEVVNMVKSVKETFGQIEILVNSAGGSSALSREEARDKFITTNRIESISEQEWDKIINVNLKGAFLVTQQVVPFMKEKRYGRIVFLSSMAARRGAEVGNGAYAAAKAGIIGLTKQFAVEFGPYQIKPVQ
jgi:NAD(P)-dependent dehydrogenase (short-subunit alcohol dehydrogenase family)